MFSYKKAPSFALGMTTFVLATLLPSAAFAQVYRCSSGGAIYISDKPCGLVPEGKFGSIGPVPDRQRDAQAPYTPSVGKAPEHQAYMSAPCASLSDAVRTGPARGLKAATMNEVRNEYQAKCQEEEHAAREQLSQQKSTERKERQSQQMAQQAERNAVTTSREQCNELLRILTGKRRQFDRMSAGEKADVQRFEENYNSRCRG